MSEAAESSWVGGVRTGAAGNLRRFESASIEPARATGLSLTHAAALEGRTIFPSTVVASADSPRLLVSGENNPKLGRLVTKGLRKGWPIFHLTLEERATCPSSCRMWNDCYGNAMHMARRHAADDGLAPKLWQEVEALAARYPEGFLVRLHTLGDFFSVEYVAEWGAMLEKHPALHVFGYTARMESDPIGAFVGAMADGMWDRFAIRFSRDVIAPQVAAVFTEDPGHKSVLMCPAQVKATEACGTCGLCWSAPARDKTIGFLRHGMKGAKVTPAASEGMRAFAGKCLAGNTREVAVDVFIDTMHDDEDVQAYVDDWIGEVIAAAAKALISEVSVEEGGGRAVTVTAERGSYGGHHNAPAPPPVKLLPEAMIVRWGASVAAGFNFVLPDGQKLGDATRADLRKAADKFATFGKEAHQKSRWLLLIAQGLPDGDTVRSRFKPSRLTELAIEAEKNTEIPA